MKVVFFFFSERRLFSFPAACLYRAVFHRDHRHCILEIHSPWLFSTMMSCLCCNSSSEYWVQGADFFAENNYMILITWLSFCITIFSGGLSETVVFSGEFFSSLVFCCELLSFQSGCWVTWLSSIVGTNSSHTVDIG